MTPAFLDAVLDTLLPGGAQAGGLPAGSAAGLRLDPEAPAAAAVLGAIAEAAGGAARFVQADEAGRGAVLRAVEQRLPGPFRAIVLAVLADYHEAELVIAALGWRSAPPQPAGHEVPDIDEPTRAMLDRVARRPKLWRG